LARKLKIVNTDMGVSSYGRRVYGELGKKVRSGMGVNKVGGWGG